MLLIDDVLLGLYIGVLTGVFAAIIVYTLTFAFTYVAGAKLSINYALMIGLGIAGVAGGPRLLMRNPEILQSVTSLVMLIVILIITFYVHKKAQDLAKSLPPKSVTVSKLRKRTLASNVVKQVGHFGQVTVRPIGEIRNIEGYPSLPAEARSMIRDDSWTLPADLPVPELEYRIKEKLEQEYHLEDAIVNIDSEGRATISAAPRVGGFSRRIPDTKRVVTVDGLLPEGLAEGDDVKMTLEETTVSGQVTSVKAANTTETLEHRDADQAQETNEEIPSAPVPVETDASGNGRTAIAIEPGDVEAVVEQDLKKLYARSKGRLKEFELVSLLHRHDLRFRKFTCRSESESLDRTLGELDLRDTYGVIVLALRRANEWRFAPEHTVRLKTNDELFVAGPKTSLDSFREMVA